MLKAVFLDRDGVINKDSPAYIKRWSEFEFLPESLKALAALKKAGFVCIVITNQSAINRNLAKKKEVIDIFSRMKEKVKENGGEIKDIYFCPHRPDENCNCRKPSPKMILDAAKAYDIDISRSVMVGDRSTDIECGARAGCRFTVLISRGVTSLPVFNYQPDCIASNLLEASKWITLNIK